VRTSGPLICLLALIAAPAVAQQATVPGFGDLERWHGRDRTDALARQRVAANIPVGASLASVEQGFAAVGGECKSYRKEAGAQRCLVHQMSMANRSFDDIRWTIMLHSDGSRVTGVTTSRYVDRHWTM
jgi:hypothetical protein